MNAQQLKEVAKAKTKAFRSVIAEYKAETDDLESWNAIVDSAGEAIGVLYDRELDCRDWLKAIKRETNAARSEAGFPLLTTLI